MQHEERKRHREQRVRAERRPEIETNGGRHRANRGAKVPDAALPAFRAGPLRLGAAPRPSLGERFDAQRGGEPSLGAVAVRRRPLQDPPPLHPRRVAVTVRRRSRLVRVVVTVRIPVAVRGGRRVAHRSPHGGLSAAVVRRRGGIRRRGGVGPARDRAALLEEYLEIPAEHRGDDLRLGPRHEPVRLVPGLDRRRPVEGIRGSVGDGEEDASRHELVAEEEGVRLVPDLFLPDGPQEELVSLERLGVHGRHGLVRAKVHLRGHARREGDENLVVEEHGLGELPLVFHERLEAHLLGVGHDLVRASAAAEAGAGALEPSLGALLHAGDPGRAELLEMRGGGRSANRETRSSVERARGGAGWTRGDAAMGRGVRTGFTRGPLRAPVRR